MELFSSLTAPQLLATPCYQPRDRRGQRHNVYHPYQSDAYSGMISPSRPALVYPNTPPPPYDALGYRCDEYAIPRTMPAQNQVYGPQQCIGLHPDPQKTHRLRKKASAWASTLDLSRRADADSHQPQQAWHSNPEMVFHAEAESPQGGFVVNSMNQSAAVCDRVADHVHTALGSLDQEEEEDGSEDLEGRMRAMTITERDLEGKPRDNSIIDFKKTWHYANSRLPRHMPPMRIYIATWQVICAAAQASMDVYRRPKKDEREDYVDADWRQGTKAMAIKSRPVDDKNLIVIAIRGSKWNIIDWAVNFRPAPSEPVGFLDDQGNACHAGFLQVARAMIAPVAARLRTLLEQNPGRASSSLLFTGHSAGGAVASLLYMHMMAETFESELNILTGCFKRVHCVTFGTPPLSLLPLQNPAGRQYERNVFMSFANEGDPVVRADRQYLSTLTRIIAAPSPLNSAGTPQSPRQKASRYALKSTKDLHAQVKPVRWDVPHATLSNAGRVVVLREKPGHRGTTEAVQVSDAKMRDVVFGDPEMHHMELYKRRIDELAIAAVTGRGGG